MLFCELLLFSLGLRPRRRISKATRVSCSLIFSFFYQDLPKETILPISVVARPTVLPAQVFSGFNLEAKQYNIRISFFLQELGVRKVFFCSLRLFLFFLLLRSKHQDQLYPAGIPHLFFVSYGICLLAKFTGLATDFPLDLPV